MNLDQLKEMSAFERKDFLETHASKVEEGRYTKPLTESEMVAYKDRLAEQSINQAIILDEFQTVKDEYKTRLEPIKKDISDALQAIKFKAVDQDGRLFLLQDFDAQMIHKVDEMGNVILSRQMRPEERQIFLNPPKIKSA